MKSNIMEINLSRDYLETTIYNYYQKKDYIKALSFLTQYKGLYGLDREACLLYTDVYGALDMVEESLDVCMQYIDNNLDDDLSDIYEVICIDFMRLGNIPTAKKYYRKLLRSLEEMSEDEIEASVEDFFSVHTKTKLKVSGNPADALSDSIKEADEQLKKENFKECREILSKISRDKRVNKTVKEVHEISILSYIGEKSYNKALEVCQKALEEYPDYVEFSLLLIKIYSELNMEKEGIALCESIYENKEVKDKDRFRMAFLCLDFKLYRLAVKNLNIYLKNDSPYDFKALFLEASLSSRLGYIRDSLNDLYKIVKLRPDAETAKYYIKKLEANEEVEMPFYYYIPEDEKERRIIYLNNALEAKDEDIERVREELEENKYLEWTYDELCGVSTELIIHGINVALYTHSDDFLRKILLKYSIDDTIKAYILRELYIRNEDDVYSCFIYDNYTKIHVNHVEIEDEYKDVFLRAYGEAAMILSIAVDDFVDLLKEIVETTYKAFKLNGCWDYIVNSNNLSASFILCSHIFSGSKSYNEICSLCEADKQIVCKIANVYNEFNEEA